MAENTKIEWAHHTFNPWYGCQRVGPGCDHCYAEGWAKRSGLVQWGAGADRRRSSEAIWKKPLKWNAEAENAWRRRKGPMAAYWRAVATYARHLAHALSKEIPQ